MSKKDAGIGIVAVAGATALVVGMGLADNAANTTAAARGARQMPRMVVAEKAREGAERQPTWPFDREAMLEARRERVREAGREGDPGEPEGEILNGAAAEQASARAYPRSYVTVRRTTVARKSYAALPDRLRRSDFRRGTPQAARQAALASSWTALGPVNPKVAAEVTYTGTPTTTSGRITALAIAPTCTAGNCRLWVAAAGGGIWRTEDALAAEPTWTALDNGLTSNTFGSIVVDPNDASGNTVYAGSGEPSGSSDSEAGVGLFKSTDGGDSWSVVPGSPAVSAGNSIAAILIDPSNPNTIRIGTALARHGSSSVNGGRRTPPDAKTMGIYKSTDGGATFSLEFSRPGDGVPPATGQDYFTGGVRRLVYDPANPGQIYASIQGYGIYRMGNPKDNDPATFNEIYRGTAAVDNFNAITPDAYGAMIDFDLANVGGDTRIYVGDTSDEYGFAFLVTADGVDSVSDADLLDAEKNGYLTPWNVKSDTDITNPAGFSSNYWCQFSQCSYDSFVKVDPNNPDTVWMGGAMNYDELYAFGGPPQSNGRAVIRSTDGGDSFTDMTNDASAQPLGMHPDQHALVFNPGKSSQVFVGSDGGLVRTDGTYVAGNSDCATREDISGTLLDPDQQAFCTAVLAKIPQKIDSLNNGLNTLQFQSVSASSTDPYTDLLGGTQDNGTWGGPADWTESVGGDGGQSGISTSGSRIHTYYGTAGDVNFDGNDPVGWNYVTGPIDSSGENSSFYVPMIADPAVPGTYFMGAESVWRTKDSGGDPVTLKTQCNELTGTGPWDDTCGDWVTVGMPLAPNASDYIVALSRTPSDPSTMWVGLRQGELFVSKNINATRTNVTYTQIDGPDTPGRFVSGIAVDPADANHAWISFSGYGAYTPGEPGHVFEARYDPASGTATFTDHSLDLGDQPVTGIALDSESGDVYASTDFGVARLAKGATSWTKAADGMPPVATYGLTIDAGARVLYAATHGRGVYSLALDPNAVITGPASAEVDKQVSFDSADSTGYKGITSVRWTLPGGATSTAQKVDWTPSQTGPQDVTLEVTDSLGHTATTTLTVNVQAKPVSALTPQFGVLTQTADGFTVVITNYNPEFTWAASTTAGSATVGTDGKVVVTGLKPGQGATVTVTTDRAGYPQGSAEVDGAAAQTCPLTVNAKKKSYKLPKSGTVKVVKKATGGACRVDPAKVTVSPKSSKVKVKRLPQGALKVTTKGKKAKVTATYVSTPRSSAYVPSTWSRTWKTKK